MLAQVRQNQLLPHQLFLAQCSHLIAQPSTAKPLQQMEGLLHVVLYGSASNIGHKVQVIGVKQPNATTYIKCQVNPLHHMK